MGISTACFLLVQLTVDSHLVGLAVGLRDPAPASAAVVLFHVHLGAGGVQVAGRV